MLLLMDYNPIISTRDYREIKLLICRQPLIKLAQWMLHSKGSPYFSQPSIPEVIAPIPRGEFEKYSIDYMSLAALNSK